MAGLSRLRQFYLLHFSKPASDRLVYREIRRKKARKIVEFGLGTGPAGGQRDRGPQKASIRPAKSITRALTSSRPG